MLEDIKTKNWKSVEGKIAEGFQSVHADDARDRAGEITLIKKLDVGQVALTDFRSTMNGDNIVVTYLISAQESIDLERLPTKPAPRLSVWEKRSERLAMDLPCKSDPHSLGDTKQSGYQIHSFFPAINF